MNAQGLYKIIKRSAAKYKECSYETLLFAIIYNYINRQFVFDAWACFMGYLIEVYLDYIPATIDLTIHQKILL